MKKFYLISMIAVLLICISSCKKSDTPDPKPVGEYKEIDISLKSSLMVDADNEFGIDLIKKILVSSEDENIMISPLSIYMALSMATNGADNETLTAFFETLNNELGIEDLNNSNKEVSNSLLNADETVDMNIANSIWYKNGFSVKQGFLNVNQEFYNSEVHELEFNNQALETINQWVRDNTNNKIEKILEYIDPADVMYIINAIYFKGTWMYEFSESENTLGAFTKEDGSSVDVEYMNQKVDVDYYENETFSMVELPYGGGNFNMLIFLPNPNNSVNDISSELSIENINEYLSGKSTKEVNLSIPKFKFEYETYLREILTSMGLGIAFTANSDFTNISDQGLFISNVKHKTFIEVNEKGTEAAAVTSINFATAAPESNEVYFIADHPFLFLIRENETGSILFIGKLNNPS